MTNPQRQISNADKCQTPNAKHLTLTHKRVCERCGNPATVHHEQETLCAVCYLKKKGKQIKPLDHTGYYP